ncbi:E3 ubiquitin-protein ligase NEURL1 [Nymphon striatum]|nr:E3 ubiquitin-protein ligase NEURL1 [Nymphon striatum]
MLTLGCIFNSFCRKYKFFHLKTQEQLLLGSRCCAPFNTGPNNLPQLLFNQTHSENVRLSRDCAVARRVESFCKGIAFSNRPLRLNEKIYLKIVETSTSWSGVLRFGVTSNDPSATRASSLPKYTCPDLTCKPGNWGKALSDRFAEIDNIIYFYVTQSGNVYYGVNGEEKGLFFSGVDTKGLLWALIDVYGNTTAVEIVDPKQHLNNRTQSANITENVIGPFSALTVNDNNNLPSRYHRGVEFTGISFNSTTKGHNIELSNDCRIAMRKPTEYSHGYVFTTRPLKVNEKYVVQIMETDNVYSSSLAFGLTSCDPASVSPREFPEDSDHLLDRPEYWVVSEVWFQKNDLVPVIIMHVDHSLKLWAFLDLYGNTVKIRNLGCYRERASEQSSSNSPPTSLIRAPKNNQSNLLVDISSEQIAGSDGLQDNARNECAVCYERPVNSVLYTCGHMCLCYECAMQQWRGEGLGQCPICRAMIQDVIRIYKS